MSDNPSNPAAPCPCSSGLAFSECCSPFLDDSRQPQTAEQLMRSRYTAYTLKRADYLVATHHPKTRDRSLKESILEWMNQVQWLGLEVVSCERGQADDRRGVVAFRASFVANGKMDVHAERSRFERVNGLWRYRDGEIG